MGQPPKPLVAPRSPLRQANRRYKVLYDGQCEICQAGASWLKLLDAHGLIDCVPISDGLLANLDSRLDLEACLRELHVLDPDGNLFVGWRAVTCLARLFPTTRLVGVLGSMWPFRPLGESAYRLVASNRYSISKCRGGACQSAKPQEVRKNAKLHAFWFCYTIGFFLRLPLIFWVALRRALERARVFVKTYGKRVDLLDGKVSILFLNGPLPNAVPLLFGELLTMILYDGVAIDPGSPKMRRSLARHLRKISPGEVRSIVATHAHEEHVGNLRWMADRTGSAIHIGAETARILRAPRRLPWARRLIIGQWPALTRPSHILQDDLPTLHGRLLVIPTPGHCDDHLALYDPEEKVLLAGDSFMGSYFSTPNPDVDSQQWLNTLERLAELEIDILVEGHGHIHTLRQDVPEIPGIVIRQHPKAAMGEKLKYLRWLRAQIVAGFREGLPIRAIEATCFPWANQSAWENFANDEMIRCLSLGHFSRTELVRSFVRNPEDVLPAVYEVRLYTGGPGDSSPLKSVRQDSVQSRRSKRKGASTSPARR